LVQHSIGHGGTRVGGYEVQVATDLSLQRHRFDPRPVHVGFAMDKLKLNRFFLKYSTFSL
jgi:hypothetical protein